MNRPDETELSNCYNTIGELRADLAAAKLKLKLKDKRIKELQDGLQRALAELYAPYTNPLRHELRMLLEDEECQKNS